MLDQISIYTENKKGTMQELLSVLTGAEINILGFVSMDSAEFGTIRLIVSDTEKACALLSEKGYLVRTGTVLGVELPDNPGALDLMLSLISSMNINMNYMYLGYRRENSMPITIISTEHLDIVSDRLKKEGYTVY